MKNIFSSIISIRKVHHPRQIASWREQTPFLLLAVLFYLTALAFRSWDNGTHPGLYMEDAGHYFNAYYGGNRYLSFILQHPNGYYNILNNFVAWLASKMDVRLQPLIYHLFSLSLGILVATCMAFTGLIRNRALLMITPLALGLSGMNHIFYYVSLTFQMYNVVILLLCLFFFPAPKTWTATFFLLLLATLCIWSGPYSVVALPAAGLCLLMFAFDKKTVLYCWIIVCSLWYTSALEGGMIQLSNILDPQLRHTILAVLFGRVFLMDALGTISVLKIALPLVLIGSLLFINRHNVFYLKITTLLFTLITASLAPLFLSNKILLYQKVFPCHIYIAQFFWLFFVLFSIDTLLQRQEKQQWAVGLLCSCGIVACVVLDNFRHPEKGFMPVMTKIPAFVQAIHAVEQLHLEKNNQYLVLRTENIDPRAAPAAVRVGSRLRQAQPADAATISIPSGREFIAQ